MSFTVEAILRTAPAWALHKAILLYAGIHAKHVATVHDVTEGVIQAGTPLTPEQLEAIASQLIGSRETEQNTKSVGFLSDRIIASTHNKLAWWSPAQTQKMFFKCSGPTKKLSGKNFKHPPLLFFVNDKKFRVFALRNNKRPDPKTELYQAPYFNVYADGAICIGTMNCPRLVGPECAPGFESAFFDSYFTDAKVRLTTLPGGHDAYWRGAMAAKEGRFLNNFVSLKATVGDLLSGRTVSQREKD